MIVCCDSHAVPKEFLNHPVFRSNLGQQYVNRILLLQSGYTNPQDVWRQLYESIRAPNWPLCPQIEEFTSLPEYIRREIKNTHLLELTYISDDLSILHVDHRNIGAADLQHQEKSARYLCELDRQVINPQARHMRMMHTTELDLALDIMTAWNDSMHMVCQTNDFFDYTIWIPPQDLDAAMQEIVRCKDRNFFALWMDERLPWPWVPEADKIFSYCNQYKIPIYLHLASLEDAPLQWQWDYSNSRFLQQQKIWNYDLKNNVRWMATVCSFITEGVLDRYPDLRIIVVEKGINWVDSFRIKMLAAGYVDPMPYLKKNFWMTIEPEDPNFLTQANKLGYDRLLFATDYAHNDPGGTNRYQDVAVLKSYRDSKRITSEEYELITNRNYQYLKSRQ
jgi:predicted TIM-barrel fold metal-dependent hydrolase